MQHFDFIVEFSPPKHKYQMCRARKSQKLTSFSLRNPYKLLINAVKLCDCLTQKFEFLMIEGRQSTDVWYKQAWKSQC